MVAYPNAPADPRTVVLFIDLSSSISFSHNFSASLVGRGPAASSQVESIITSTIRRAISEAIAKAETFSAPETSSRSELARLNNMTRAERELLDLLALGMSNAGIATQRQVTINTVKTQVAGLIRKLGLSNRTQAALFAAKVKLPK
jgi:DNA-binding NarL/FixJ family response regulator